MTDPTHFHDFKPCEPVQYDADGSNAQEIADLMNAGSYHKEWAVNRGFQSSLRVPLVSHWEFDTREDVKPGQWVVVQGDKVWVQDDEPPRVERWETGFRQSLGVFPSTPANAHIATHYRPVLSNGWSGPWMPVEGGGE